MANQRFTPKDIRFMSGNGSGVEHYLRHQLGLDITPSKAEDPTLRILQTAFRLYQTARNDRHWNATEAIALINPTILGGLCYPGMRTQNSRGRIHQLLKRLFSEEWHPGVTPLAHLRREILLDENPKRLLNLEEATRNGHQVNFSTSDLQWGLRIHDFSSETYFLLGVLQADGFRSGAGNRIRLAGQTGDEEFYRNTVRMLLDECFHLDRDVTVTPRTKETMLSGGRMATYRWNDVWIDLQSRGFRTFLEEMGFVEPQVVSHQFNGLSRSRFLERVTDDDVEAYAVGLIAAAGHPHYRKGGSPRLDFIDRRGKYTGELQWAIGELGTRFPARLQHQGPDRHYLNRDGLHAVAAATPVVLVEEQHGYLLHPRHLELLEATLR